LDDGSAQVFPYNIFTYCSVCRVDCKFARTKKIKKKNPIRCCVYPRVQCDRESYALAALNIKTAVFNDMAFCNEIDRYQLPEESMHLIKCPPPPERWSCQVLPVR
jgi:hypothetical protein